MNTHVPLTAAPMITAAIPFDDPAKGWRSAARQLLTAHIRPEEIEWAFDAPQRETLPRSVGTKVRVTERFLELADHVCLHAAPERFDLLYRLIWRMRLDPTLMSSDDAEVALLCQMERTVMRAAAEMRRGLRVHMTGQGTLAGWHDSRHDVLPLIQPWLVRHFSEFSVVVQTPRRQGIVRDGVCRWLRPLARPALPRDTGDPMWGSYLRAVHGPQALSA